MTITQPHPKTDLKESHLTRASDYEGMKLRRIYRARGEWRVRLYFEHPDTGEKMTRSFALMHWPCADSEGEIITKESGYPFNTVVLNPVQNDLICVVDGIIAADLLTTDEEGNPVPLEEDEKEVRDFTVTDARVKREDEDYEDRIYSGIPLYSCKLVRDGDFKFNERTQVTSPDEVGDFLTGYFKDKDREQMVVVLLDTANTIIGLHVVSTGSLNASIVDPKNVFKPAILANAAAVILAHNHPSGNPEPSHEDIHITRQCAEAGKLLSLPVHDHLIIAEDQVTSLAARGCL